MADLKTLAIRVKSSSMSIDKFCKVKKYISVQEKFKFVDEYKELLKDHIQDYESYKSFVAFIFFDLVAVKYYTDIKIDGTYEEYDLLHESGLMDKLLEIFGEDYLLLVKLVKEKELNFDKE